MLGSEVIRARSSMACADAPSSPTEMPPWEATSLTFMRCCADVHANLVEAVSRA